MTTPAPDHQPATPGRALRQLLDALPAVRPTGVARSAWMAVRAAAADAEKALDAAPATYALLPAPPEGTQLRGRSGLHWQRYPAGWSNGVRHAIGWSYLLSTDGPLSTAPPAGTEDSDA